jgi:mono/diheme cytochrome c family protein
MDKFIKAGAKATFIFLWAAMLYSCGRTSADPGLEYAPQMYDPIPYEALKQLDGQENPNNPGGLNMREPAKGTIARGQLAFYDDIAAESAEEAGNMLRNPLEATADNLAEGEVLYSRFCSPCHGETGAGDGLVGQKFKGVPNLQVGRYATLPQGYIYHVITNGRGRMMPYGSMVNPEERWKIALYVRQIQSGDPAAPVDAQVQPGDPGASTQENTNQVTGTEQDPQEQPGN